MKKLQLLLLLGFAVISCTDPYKLQTTTFDEALVVEATITNEMKRQEIKISKTYRLEEDASPIVTGANVVVSDNVGNSYDFSEENGSYLSDIAFEAVADREYTLNITTADGKSYSSTTEKLTTASPITEVTATAETVQGESGVQIRVSSFDPTGTAKYYRYRYDETYKIIAPKWVGVYALLSLDLNPEWTSYDYIQIHPRTYEARICYSTDPSQQIVVTSTTTQSEDRVDNFPVRFISAQNSTIAHRYSINVFQYVQSLAAHTFYKTLSQMGGDSGNILSQNQPGFFSGNLQSDNDPDEKVIGFFEVSSVSQQRIFFNRADVLPDAPQPPFFENCDIISLDATKFSREDNQGAILRSNILSGSLLYYNHVGNIYDMVPKECGDCTTFSSNVVPAFWID